MPESGCAVVFEPGKAGELLAGFDGDVGLRIGDVGERFAVDFFRDLGERRVVRIRVGERGVENGIGELAAFFLIKVANFQEDSCEDFLIEAGLPGRG